MTAMTSHVNFAHERQDFDFSQHLIASCHLVTIDSESLRLLPHWKPCLRPVPREA